MPLGLAPIPTAASFGVSGAMAAYPSRTYGIFWGIQAASMACGRADARFAHRRVEVHGEQVDAHPRGVERGEGDLEAAGRQV